MQQNRGTQVPHPFRQLYQATLELTRRFREKGPMPVEVLLFWFQERANEFVGSCRLKENNPVVQPMSQHPLVKLGETIAGMIDISLAMGYTIDDIEIMMTEVADRYNRMDPDRYTVHPGNKQIVKIASLPMGGVVLPFEMQHAPVGAFHSWQEINEGQETPSTIPPGWLLCDGSLISVADFPELALELQLRDPIGRSQLEETCRLPNYGALRFEVFVRWQLIKATKS